MTNKKVLQSTLVAAALAAAGACGDSPAEAGIGTTELAVVTPAGDQTGVDPAAPIVIEFSHAMGAGMEMYVTLHEGEGVSGPLMQGTAEWSPDRTSLTFTPAAALEPQTSYTIHIGGGMRDEDGHIIDMEEHGPGMGGEWATRQMMEDRMMGGGMMGGDDMMGPGWQHANGTFGMLFTFTTA
jgi:hypothetical protein